MNSQDVQEGHQELLIDYLDALGILRKLLAMEKLLKKLLAMPYRNWEFLNLDLMRLI